MIKNLIIAFEAVVPMFILMAIGMGIRSSGFLNDSEVRKLNGFIFKVCFAPLMFISLYDAKIGINISYRFIGFAVLGVLSLFLITMAIVPFIEKDNKTRGAMIQAIYRSNFVIMGIPMAKHLAGADNMAVATIAVSIIVPLFNVLAICDLEIFRGEKINVKNILKQLCKNPLILGALTGAVFRWLQIPLPDIIHEPVAELSTAATPMALVILGAAFKPSKVKGMIKQLTISVLGKLVLAPAIFLPISALLGFRGVEFVVLTAMFTAPTAVSSYTMADQMDSNGELAGSCVIFSSALSCFTMFLWIFMFKSLGMF